MKGGGQDLLCILFPGIEFKILLTYANALLLNYLPGPISNMFLSEGEPKKFETAFIKEKIASVDYSAISV